MAGKKAVRGWMSKLHGMPASYELKEDEVRQLLFDLVSARGPGAGRGVARPRWPARALRDAL